MKILFLLKSFFGNLNALEMHLLLILNALIDDIQTFHFVFENIFFRQFHDDIAHCISPHSNECSEQTTNDIVMI